MQRNLPKSLQIVQELKPEGAIIIELVLFF